MTAETTKRPWSEAEIHCTAGEIALKSPQADAAGAQADFDGARGCSRAAGKVPGAARVISMTQLWGDQRKQQQACGLLAPIYGRFTEGWMTLDLKEAKALLDEVLRGWFTKQGVGRLKNESDSRS
jgi:predicted ATPase